jgi:hypothetical protein
MKRTVLALTLAAACRGNAPAPQPATTSERPAELAVVPQSHDFPAGRAAEIRRIFDGDTLSYPITVTGDKGVQTQFVNPKPVFISESRFVVGLPPASHAALDKLIAGLGQGAAAFGATYELTYWVVEADAAAETQVSHDLEELKPTFEKLAALGTRHYKSLDRLASRTRDGENTELTGRLLHAEHRLAAGPDGIDLKLFLQLKGVWADKPNEGPMVQTTLHVPPDVPVILGDSGLGGSGDTSNLLLYVVRAHRVE